MKNSVALSISVLNADFSKLAESLQAVECFADSFHIDIMDGTLTPIISFGSWIIPVLRSIVKSKLEVHLYVRNPIEVYPEVMESGASRVIVNSKAAKDILASRKIGSNEDIGIFVLPTDDPRNFDSTIFENISIVNIITVNSLRGGQEISWALVEKTRWFDDLRDKHGFSFDISIDGGINEAILDRVLEYPIDQVVIGSAIFNSDDPSVSASRFKEKITCL